MMIVIFYYYDDDNKQRNFLYILLRITIIIEIRDGVDCRMGGLRQACARTIHGYYYIWVENPFFMFV